MRTKNCSWVYYGNKDFKYNWNNGIREPNIITSQTHLPSYKCSFLISGYTCCCHCCLCVTVFTSGKTKKDTCNRPETMAVHALQFLS